MLRRKEYKAIGITQDNDATCHSRDQNHNVSRKCKAIKRKTSKRNRVMLRKDLKEIIAVDLCNYAYIVVVRLLLPIT